MYKHHMDQNCQYVLNCKKTTHQHQKLRQLESWDQAVSTGQQGSWKVRNNISSLLIHTLINRITWYSRYATLRLPPVPYPCFETWSRRCYEASRFGAQTITFLQKIFLHDWYSMVWAHRLWHTPASGARYSNTIIETILLSWRILWYHKPCKKSYWQKSLGLSAKARAPTVPKICISRW